MNERPQIHKLMNNAELEQELLKFFFSGFVFFLYMFYKNKIWQY